VFVTEVNRVTHDTVIVRLYQTPSVAPTKTIDFDPVAEPGRVIIIVTSPQSRLIVISITLATKLEHRY